MRPTDSAMIALMSVARAPRRFAVMAAALTMASAFIVAPAAHAVDNASASVPSEVRGVKLTSICSVCGVVSDVRAETRDAPASAKGAVAGAVVGGLAGHGLGSGSGKTAATVIGAIGGGVAGNAIEKKMKRVTVWTTTVVFKDGTVRAYERTSNQAVQPGDIVVIADGHPVRVER